MSTQIGSRRNVPMKVIDTWTYKVKDVEAETREYVEADEEDMENGRDSRPESERHVMRKKRIKNKLITMRLELHKTNLQSEEPPHPTEKVHFEVYCEELSLRMEGTDIEVLRAAIWDYLDTKYQVKWEYYYLVRVDKQNPWHADGTGLIFSYDGVYKGTTWDGKLLLKEYSGSEFKIKVWPGEFTDKGGNVIACVPATDMNQAALKEFASRIDILRGKLADFLRPEAILKTLSDMSGLALLPPVAADQP